ncbi:MAG: phospho-sugar mutase [Verrucomicrobia bacterium]|nr:phospho-sugar mutase [Verrucomicrobiota bacterium]MDA1065152.1 phospho-sugar mutase [Verrucomicrobiota bacterium]
MSLIESIKLAGSESKILPSTAENMALWVEGNFLPDWALESIQELLNKEAFEELNDRFYKNMEFGTGGMRGRTIGRISAEAELGTLSDLGTPAHPAIGSNVLNDFNLIRATIGLFNYSKQHLKHCEIFDVPKLVIAHDVRHFSRYFCELAASTWTRLGGLAMIFEGPRSTPHLSFSVRKLNATAGIVITASHNPPHDNGFKAYFSDGAQVVEPHASGIIDKVNEVALAETAKHLEIDLSEVVTLPDSIDEAYFSSVLDVVLDKNLFKESKVKVVFTPIHGTGGVASVPVLERLGVSVDTVPEQDAFDPRFPTVKSPNPENAEALSMAITQAESTGADVVIATDPDCDRMGVAVRDSEGKMQLLSGNMIGSVMAEYRIGQMKESGILPPGGTEKAVLIKTFVTTPLQDAIGKAHGLKVINTLTGFKWIGEKIGQYEQQLQNELKKQHGYQIDYDNTNYLKRADLLQEHSTFYVFGGEESYGYLGSDAVRDKDGNAAVVMFCEIAAYLKSQGKTFLDYLDSLYCKYGYYFETLGNVYYEGAAGAQKIKNILDSYRSDSPKEIGGIAVTEMKDFGVQIFEDADGQTIPKQDFYFLTLANGYQYAVRGSGTEPKIKFYLFGREDVADPSELEEKKALTQSAIESMKEAILADTDARAEG